MCEKLNFLLMVILGLVQRRHKSSDSETSHLERYMYLAIIGERERERERERGGGGGGGTDRQTGGNRILNSFFLHKRNKPRATLSRDESMIICWHPEPKYPYECSKVKFRSELVFI